MEKTVRKWFWAWNDNKEEEFLEDMALQGWKLVHAGLGIYRFIKDEPRKVKYQLDFKGLSKISDTEYYQLFEDAGWEYVNSMGSWHYFRQEYEEDQPDVSIFNDNKSRIEKYRRIIIFLLVTGFPLYYNVVILFPALDQTEFEFPKFYFFFRIIATILVVIHAAAMARIGYKIYKDRKDIRE